MTPMLSIFTQAMEFDRLFLAIFQSFRVFLCFIFDKLATLLNIYASKDALNYYLSPFQSIKQSQKCKNGVFFLFCILVDMPMVGEGL